MNPRSEPKAASRLSSKGSGMISSRSPPSFAYGPLLPDLLSDVGVARSRDFPGLLLASRDFFPPLLENFFNDGSFLFFPLYLPLKCKTLLEQNFLGRAQMPPLSLKDVFFFIRAVAFCFFS